MKTTQFLFRSLAICGLGICLALSSGCRTSQGSDTSLLDTAKSDDGPCLKRARGAAADLHKKFYETGSITVKSVKFLGEHKFGLTKHIIYLVNNTDEVDGASVLLAFELTKNGKCSYIPFVPENQDTEDDSDTFDQSYAVLSY
jgi:hypothetical protein